MPKIVVTVLDGQLGVQPGNNERLLLHLGPCTAGAPNTLYTAGSSSVIASDLGLGQLSDLSTYVLDVGGGPIMMMPTGFSTAGGKSAVTHVGTGAMTCSVSFAPWALLTVKCTTSGALGTAAFTFQWGTGPVSAPVVSASSWSSTGYLPLGGYTNLVFAAGSYASTSTQDVYTITTLGVYTHATGSGPDLTPASSPIDNYNALISVITAGALGTSQFTSSLDNGCPQLAGAGFTSNTITTTGGGVYAIPNSGVVLTFSGTAVAGDTYQFTTCGPQMTAGDLSAALTPLTTTLLGQAVYADVVVLGMPVSAAAWETLVASLQTAATTLFNQGVYVRFICEAPSVGSITASAGAVVVDAADTDSVMIAAMATVSAVRVAAGCGDCLLVSPLTGLTLRRSAAWPLAARVSEIEASQDVGYTGLGGVDGVVYLFRDEVATPALEPVGFNVLGHYPAYPGFYFQGGHTCTISTSDYFALTNARVMDRLCGISRTTAMQTPGLLAKIPTTTRAGQPGVITNLKAQQINGAINGAISSGMINTSPQDLVSASVACDLTHNILADGKLIIAVSGQPFGYDKEIDLNIGLSVSA